MSTDKVSAVEALQKLHAEVQADPNLRMPERFATKWKADVDARARVPVPDSLPADQHGSNHPAHIFSAPSAVYHPRGIDASDMYDSHLPDMVHIRGGTLNGLTPS